MLLKTLLKKVISYLAEHPGHEAHTRLGQIAAVVDKSVDQLILGIDVRGIGQLREIVPEAFPKKLRAGPIMTTQNTHGAWRVDPQPLLKMPAGWDPARDSDSGGYYG